MEKNNANNDFGKQLKDEGIELNLDGLFGEDAKLKSKVMLVGEITKVGETEMGDEMQVQTMFSAGGNPMGVAQVLVEAAVRVAIDATNTYEGAHEMLQELVTEYLAMEIKNIVENGTDEQKAEALEKLLGEDDCQCENCVKRRSLD